MIATLDAKGVLTIKAESSLESYALEKWSEGYMKQENTQCESVLMIDTGEEWK